MEKVTTGGYGQVFITDTHLERIPNMFHSTGTEVNVYEVVEGEVNTLVS